MSGALLETWFVQHLLDVDSMAVIAKAGLHPEVLPTQELRGLYKYALDYYFDSGKTTAVTIAALSTYDTGKTRTWLDILTELGIDPSEDPELTITDVITKLKGQYIRSNVQKFNLDFGQLMAEASVEDQLTVASRAAGDLMAMISRLTPRRQLLTAAEGVEEAIQAYEQRKAGIEVEGMAFGVKELDEHLMLLHPGELGIFGAFAKFGKSLLSVNCALEEWNRGRNVALNTLENSIEMTSDRFVCAAVRVDSNKWQHGECDEGEIQRIMAFKEKLAQAPNKVYFLQPPGGQRTVEFMVRQANVLDCDSLIIDQLSHIEHPNPKNKSRWEIVRDILQSLKLALNGPDPMPCWIFAQISREGKKNADSRGRYAMEDFAESSEVERSVDVAVTGYQSRDMFIANQALLQIVAARRVQWKSWSTMWYPGMAQMKVRGEV